MDEDELTLPPKFSLIVSTPIPPTPRKSPTLVCRFDFTKVNQERSISSENALVKNESQNRKVD